MGFQRRAEEAGIVEGSQRPTKKQYELLEFIERFVVEHGYGPSYREIMSGCNYTSVATVALHVNNLISKGLLAKNGRSARSLEVVNNSDIKNDVAGSSREKQSHEQWLISLINTKLRDQADLDELQTLTDSLKILGFARAAEQFSQKIEELKQNRP